ncbi:tellurite resistance/C4-dicarboxylate transporter family protein [Sporosarcina cascadiensis]|uniref:tellurite resistance/C4-dicarboxylate transporter family protein n=1 Tax=Sporosarcina cascadiensis TaxID=2660747 RepID=UPI00129A5E20|nr:tellurite resistance/C4-dicarboxylate transporter family protein [Sporosarcina cascadiensis]
MFTLLKKQAQNLFPGYFALIMATGALSISSFLLKMVFISKLFLAVNIAAFIVLWFLTLIRLFFYFPDFCKDLISHKLGPSFFTLIAGTAMFGSQLIIIGGHHRIAVWLWVLAIFLWIVIMYTFFTAVTIRKNKPAIAQGINGAWLIAAVATQSISILGTLLSPHLVSGRTIVLFSTLCMYFLGCMLYLNIITLIFYRFTFVDLKYAALSPPYWINMGAVAITTLAGSMLILHAKYWPMLQEITPFLKGFTLFFWITGTWWIPLLFILMLWRYFYHHYPLSYDPQIWGMVFPLSMYVAGTFQLSKALQLPFLLIIPKIMFYIALATWMLAFFGMLHHIYQKTANK